MAENKEVPEHNIGSSQVRKYANYRSLAFFRNDEVLVFFRQLHPYQSKALLNLRITSLYSEIRLQLSRSNNYFMQDGLYMTQIFIVPFERIVKTVT